MSPGSQAWVALDPPHSGLNSRDQYHTPPEAEAVQEGSAQACFLVPKAGSSVPEMDTRRMCTRARYTARISQQAGVGTNPDLPDTMGGEVLHRGS